MRRIRKSFFTILEVLITISILLVVAAVTGIKLKDAYDEQRFFSEAQGIVGHLRMAQDLMLVLDTDVKFRLVIDPDKDKAEYWLQTEQPIEISSFKHFLFDKEGKFKRHSLSMVRSYNFEGQTQIDKHTAALAAEEPERDREEGLTLLFSFGKTSQGILKLTSASPDRRGGDETAYVQVVVLKGYPHPIKASKENPQLAQKVLSDPQKLIGESQKIYPKITQEEQ